MGRKDKTGQPQTPNEPQGRDLFQTPNYAIDLLIPFIPKSIKTIWEPAAGNGKIVTRLEKNNFAVFSSDIRFDPLWIDCVFNFITDKNLESLPAFDCIITNPPFSIADSFFNRCIEIGKPFALLVNSDYCEWKINAIRNYGCEKLVPIRRIDYITPTGLSGATGHTADFHSMWLTYKFNLGRTETFVELTNQEKKENI